MIWRQHNGFTFTSKGLKLIDMHLAVPGHILFHILAISCYEIL